jgi:hypothetical protein
VDHRIIIGDAIAAIRTYIEKADEKKVPMDDKTLPEALAAVADRLIAEIVRGMQQERPAFDGYSSSRRSPWRQR